MIREWEMKPLPGVPALIVSLLVFLGSVSAFIASAAEEAVVPAIFFGLVWAANLVFLFGFFIVNPNESKVIQLFGRYVGTVRDAGLKWANPFFTKRKISVRVRNFESNKLKVNEQDGSPIEIATVVVWRVVDTAEAAFEVDNYENFVHVQTESALRNL